MVAEHREGAPPNGACASRCVVALEKRLHRCRNVVTLGVRPNLEDYSAADRALLLKAAKIYYPSSFYAGLFAAMGKPVFPSPHNYLCAQDKIRQTTLFALNGIPHPRTRIFYGQRQKAKILDYFAFPFVAKIPRGSARGRGVYLIRDAGELEDYCRRTHAAYIQQYLPVERDLRVVVIAGRVVHAYWRTAPQGDFRTNVSGGGGIVVESVPEAALHLARDAADACGWDDVGIDICPFEGRYYVIEANMKYGLEGFRRAGLDYTRMMEDLIRDGTI